MLRCLARATARSHPLLCAVLLGAAAGGCGPRSIPLGDADYAKLRLPSACATGSRDGATGATDGWATSGGLHFSVRTPRNYDSTLAHPLLVVFAPAGFTRHGSERLGGLTPAATSAGYVVAYADHRALAMSTFRQAGEIPALIAARWCIDTRRIALMGHSDGATTAQAVAFLRTSALAPAALVASAAGLRGADLAQYDCPPAVAVLVVHGRLDDRFPLPEFGRGPAQWWASCNRCAEPRRAADQPDCIDYAVCSPGGATRFCEVGTGHAEWPVINGQVLRFLQHAGADTRSQPH